MTLYIGKSMKGKSQSTVRPVFGIIREVLGFKRFPLRGEENIDNEYYTKNNITIETIPSESGNSALVFKAKRETISSNKFTSSKVATEGKLSGHNPFYSFGAPSLIPYS